MPSKPDSNEERCARADRVRRLMAAYRAGDLSAVKAELGCPEGFPNVDQPFELACGDRPLISAITWAPIDFIRGLLQDGADTNYEAQDGLPPLLEVLQTPRDDQIAVLRLLLAFGADPGQRGVNDWTALHYAVASDNLAAIEALMVAGADPHLATRIDDCSSALEDARAKGFAAAVGAMGG